MNQDFGGGIADRASLMGNWRGLLLDKEALLSKPGAHHKALLREAHQLHQEQVIDDGELCDFLELADAALAFAIESLHDIKTDEQRLPHAYAGHAAALARCSAHTERTPSVPCDQVQRHGQFNDV